MTRNIHAVFNQRAANEKTNYNFVKERVGRKTRGYKTFFMLNSVELEILNAHKYKNINKIGFY